MAYIADPNDEDALQKQQGGQSTSGVVGTSTPGQTSASGTGGTAPAGNPTAPTSTGFVNLQSYLNANQGTGAGLANTATKPLTDQVGAYGQTAANTVSGAKSGFDAAGGDAQAASAKSGLANDATAGYDAASHFVNSGYSGPKASDYTGTLATQQGNLDGQLNGVDKQANQQDLLSSAYGGNGKQYTNGFGQLDSFLIGGSQDGRNVINGVKGQTANVDGAYNSAANSLNGMQTTAQNQLAANQSGVRSAAGTDATNIVNGAQPMLGQKNGTLNSSNVGTAQASLGDVLTDKNKTDLQALSQLSGQAYNPDWNKKTFNAGTAAVASPDAAFNSAPGSGGKNNSGLTQVQNTVGNLNPLQPNSPTNPLNGANYNPVNGVKNTINAAAPITDPIVHQIQSAIPNVPKFNRPKVSL